MSDGEIVLGVDTHKDIHVAAIVDQVGRLVCTSEFPVSERGLPTDARVGAALRCLASGRRRGHRELRLRACQAASGCRRRSA